VHATDGSRRARVRLNIWQVLAYAYFWIFVIAIVIGVACVVVLWIWPLGAA